MHNIDSLGLDGAVVGPIDHQPFGAFPVRPIRAGDAEPNLPAA